MTIRHILVATDFSAGSNRAVERAAHLAGQHQAQLSLMHVNWDGDTHPPNAGERLALTARRLSRKLDSRVNVIDKGSGLPMHLLEASHRADLLVLAFRSEHPFTALLRGRALDRVTRHCQCPVLLVKNEAPGPYRQVMVAVDLSPRSHTLVKLACAIAGDADVGLFHATNTRGEAMLRSAEASYAAISIYRREVEMYARGRLIQLADSFEARRNRVMSVVGRGDPAMQVLVHRDHANADIVIIGKGHRPRWMDWLLGSITHRIVDRVASDVMVVPTAARSTVAARAISAWAP